MSKVKTGITLFSLGTPYLKGELDLEGVIRTAAGAWRRRLRDRGNTDDSILPVCLG